MTRRNHHEIRGHTSSPRMWINSIGWREEIPLKESCLRPHLCASYKDKKEDLSRHSLEKAEWPVSSHSKDGSQVHGYEWDSSWHLFLFFSSPF